MRGVFEDEERAPLKPRRDTELTLSSGALLGLFFGLVLLCVLCVGLGYWVGRRGSAPAAALPVPSQPIAANNSLAKPPATAQADQAQTPDADDSGQPPDGATPGANPAPVNPALSAQAPPAAAPAAAQTGQLAVHPALPSAAAPVQAAQAAPAPAGSPQAGSPSAGSLMVQIAAVSQLEDAQVLIDALRKRGYAVTAHRDPADNLIHVRIGPFTTMAEANSWRMKLLNDGYNAVVEP